MGDGLHAAMARRASHFSVVALDSSGRRRREGGDPFVVSIRGPGAVTTSVRDAQDGTYSVGWVANVSGTYWIVVSLYGEHIAGSPFSAQVSVPHADARQCRLAGLGLREAVAGEPAQFRIDFADVADRAVPAESLDLALDLEGGGGRRDAAEAAGFSLGGLVAVPDGPEGAFHARYSVGRAGIYELHVRLRSSGEALPGSPFTLHVSPAPAHAPTIELPLEELPWRSSAGTTDFMTIKALDRLHNPCISGGEEVTADVVRGKGGDGWDDSVTSSDVRCSVVDRGDGSYEVRWHGERRGMYRLNVRLRGVHVGASPVVLRMLSGKPDPGSCAMSGEGLQHATAGKEALLVVACKDRFGNPVDADKRTRMWLELRVPRSSEAPRKESYLGSHVALGTTVSTRVPGDNAVDFEAGDERGIQECEALWADDGLMELRYKTTRAGIQDVVLWCEHEGEAYELLTAVEALYVSPQPPSLFHSSIVHAHRLEKKTLKAGTRMQLALKLVDQFGNTCIEPEKVSVTLMGPDGTGRATSLAARPLTLAELEDPSDKRFHMKDPVPKSPRSPRSPNSPRASPCAVSLAATHAGGGPDGHGGDVFEDVGASFQAVHQPTTPVADIGVAAPQMLRMGRATHLIEHTCGAAGEFRLHVTLSNKEIEASPTTYLVAAGPAHGSRSELVPPPMPVLTHAPCEFMVQARDRWGNKLDVGGATVAARTNGPGAMQCIVVDNADGTYTVTLIASCSGEYRVIASLDGHQVVGSPHGLSVVHAGSLPPHQRAAVERAAVAREMAGSRTPRTAMPSHTPWQRDRSDIGSESRRAAAIEHEAWVEHVAAGEGTVEHSLQPVPTRRSMPTATALRNSASAPSIGGGGGLTPRKATTPRADGSTTPRPGFGSTTPRGGGGSTTPRGGSTTPRGGSTTPRGGSTTPRGVHGDTSQERYHAALKAATPAAGRGYMDATASSRDSQRLPVGTKAVVAHYGRMCNPKQAFAISESRAVERDIGAFEGASTPRGRDSTALQSSRTTRGLSPGRALTAAKAGSYPWHGGGDGVPTLRQLGYMDVSDRDPSAPVMIAMPGTSFVAGPAEVATGKVAVLLVCACDQHGVPVPHGGDPFIASVHGPAACRTEMRDLLDGRYELRVATPAVSGDFRVSVTLHGRAIGGSPHSLKLLAPIAHSDFCEAHGSALELANAGEPATFDIVANDAHGRRVNYGGEQYSVRLRRLNDLADSPASPVTPATKKKKGRGVHVASGGKAVNFKRTYELDDGGEDLEGTHERIFYGRVEDRRDGSYSCTYNIAVSGKYKLTVHCLKSGKEIKGSPWQVLVAPGQTYAPSSFLRGRELGKGIAGELLTFMLHARDARGNQQLFGGEPWLAQIVGPYPNTEPLEVPLDDRGDGTYKGQLTMALSGEYSLAVTLRGAHARGSPLRIGTVASGVHAPRCIAEGSGVRAGFKGQVCKFAIVARDAFGNRVSRGAHGYNVRVRPPLSATKAPDVYVADKGDGTCGVEWLPTTRGRHVVSITLGGVPIEGSDFICHVV